MSQQGTENSVCTLILWICFDFITIMILQNTNTKFNLLWIKSVYSWVYYPGEHKKICWVLQQEPEKSIFKLDLMLLLQWFCKTPLPDSTYFEFKTLIPWCATLNSHKKEKKCWLSQQRSEKSILRFILQIGFNVIATMILQNSSSRFIFFETESFIPECVL